MSGATRLFVLSANNEPALRERAAYWGSHVGRPAAEPFAVLREVT